MLSVSCLQTVADFAYFGRRQTYFLINDFERAICSHNLPLQIFKLCVRNKKLYSRHPPKVCEHTGLDGSVALVFQDALVVDMMFGNNNVDCPNLSSATSTVTTPKVYDDDATTLDPEFTDADKADFTVGNALLLQRRVGDPRWIK